MNVSLPDLLGPITTRQAKDLYEGLRFQNQSGQYGKYLAYVQGDQPLKFATAKFTEAFGTLFKALTDNYCSLVVQILADQLQLETVTLPEELGEAEQERFDEWLKFQRLDALSRQVHEDGFTYGNTCLIAAPDPLDSSRLKLYKQDPFNIRVAYSKDDPETLALAMKVWLDEDWRWQLRLYAKEGLYRYESARQSDQDKNPSLPAALTAFRPPLDESFAPYAIPGRIPVFHFAHKPGRDGLGLSALKDLIPLQDALNKTLSDMMVAAEFGAARQRWVTGAEYEIDPDTGQIKAPFDPMGLGRLLISSSDTAKFGEFDATDLKNYLSVAEDFRKEIARLSRIPIFHLVMSENFPSGEALKTAHEPLKSRIESVQAVWGNVWEDIAQYWLAWNRQSGAWILDADWVEISPRSEIEEAQADKAASEAANLDKQLGVSMKTLIEKRGYDPDMELKQREKEDAAQDARQIEKERALGENLLTRFNRGEET